MENENIVVLQKKIDELNATINRQHAEHLGWLNQMLQQENQMIMAQIGGGVRQELQSLKRALGITDANMPFEPYYNRGAELTSRQPEIYNRYGERLHVVFMSDRESAHGGCGNFGRYMYTDRYNYGLKNHFYTHDELFRTVGKPDNKFALFSESRAIRPQSYTNVLKNKAYVQNEFRYLFTFDAELLNSVSNARLLLYAGYWYGAYKPTMGREKESVSNVVVSVDNYKNKDKNISIIASEKRMCRGHLIRQAFARKCKAEHLADTFGRFDGGEYCPIELPFQHYRYSIAIENDFTPYYFTEKITNCFASMTIPIYLGASEIGKFYNLDGIITIKESDLDNLDKVLKQCTPQEYERRLPAVIDNFNRLMNYAKGNSGIDLLYRQFLRPFFEPQQN